MVNGIKAKWMGIIHRVKQVRWIPKPISMAIANRRRQALLKELEIERLDRLCNSSQYVGK